MPSGAKTIGDGYAGRTDSGPMTIVVIFDSSAIVLSVGDRLAFVVL
jgi:hypothetical protein